MTKRRKFPPVSKSIWETWLLKDMNRSLVRTHLKSLGPDWWLRFNVVRKELTEAGVHPQTARKRAYEQVLKEAHGRSTTIVWE